MIKKRTTIYIDPKLAKLLKLRAVQTEQSVSDYLSRVITEELLETEQDLKDIQAVLDEPSVSFEEMLKELKIEHDL